MHIVEVIGRRVDADDGIATPEQQTVQHARGDTFRVVSRVIGLQPRRKPPRQAEGIAETRDDPDAAGNRDQVLIAHQLGHRRRHFGCQSACKLRQAFAVCLA